MKDDLITKVQKDVMQEQKHSDGIGQLVGGLFLVFTMLLMMSNNGNTFVVFIPILPIAIEALKKRFTHPRIGYAKINDNRTGRMFLRWIIVAVLIGLLAVFILYRNRQLPDYNTKAIYPVLMFGIAFVVILLSILMFVQRKGTQFIWYAGFILAFTVAVLLFRLQKNVVFPLVLTFGAANVIVGGINLYRFIKKYPVLKDGE